MVFAIGTQSALPDAPTLTFGGPPLGGSGGGLSWGLPQLGGPAGGPIPTQQPAVAPAFPIFKMIKNTGLFGGGAPSTGDSLGWNFGVPVSGPAGGPVPQTLPMRPWQNPGASLPAGPPQGVQTVPVQSDGKNWMLDAVKGLAGNLLNGMGAQSDQVDLIPVMGNKPGSGGNSGRNPNIAYILGAGVIAFLLLKKAK